MIKTFCDKCGIEIPVGRALNTFKIALPLYFGTQNPPAEFEFCVPCADIAVEKIRETMKPNEGVDRFA